MILVCKCRLIGISPISFGAPIQSERNTGETHDAFEERTWRERMHVDENGRVFMPPNALKNMLSEAARMLSESVPGKGKATYTKHFEAGIMVTDPLLFGAKAAEVKGERLFVPADGKRGGGKRVWKTFPYIVTWATDATIYALDPVLIDKPEVIQKTLGHGGNLIGLGRFRPRNNGYYGRFSVDKWSAEKTETI